MCILKMELKERFVVAETAPSLDISDHSEPRGTMPVDGFGSQILERFYLNRPIINKS